MYLRYHFPQNPWTNIAIQPSVIHHNSMSSVHLKSHLSNKIVGSFVQTSGKSINTFFRCHVQQNLWWGGGTFWGVMSLGISFQQHPFWGGISATQADKNPKRMTSPDHPKNHHKKSWDLGEGIRPTHTHHWARSPAPFLSRTYRDFVGKIQDGKIWVMLGRTLVNLIKIYFQIYILCKIHMIIQYTDNTVYSTSIIIHICMVVIIFICRHVLFLRFTSSWNHPEWTMTIILANWNFLTPFPRPLLSGIFLYPNAMGPRASHWTTSSNRVQAPSCKNLENSPFSNQTVFWWKSVTWHSFFFNFTNQIAPWIKSWLLVNEHTIAVIDVVPSLRMTFKWVGEKDLQASNSSLVGGFNPFEKSTCQIGSFPQIVGVKIKKILELPPARFHVWDCFKLTTPFELGGNGPRLDQVPLTSGWRSTDVVNFFSGGSWFLQFPIPTQPQLTLKAFD